MDGGDLGLGRGLKPGALPKDETHFDFIPNDIVRDTTCKNKVVNTTETVIHLAKCFQDVSIDTQRNQHDTVNGIVADSETAEYDSNTSSDLEASRDSKQSIVIGTSLQQQKHLFSRDLENVRRHISSSQEDIKSSSKEKHAVSRLEKNLENQLQKAKKEIESLKKDLTQCRDELTSKVKVIQVLRSQIVLFGVLGYITCGLMLGGTSELITMYPSRTDHAMSLASQLEDENVICKLKQLNEDLQKEVNQLTFALAHKDSAVTTSQQTWADRFDSLAVENAALHDVLQDKTEDMKQMHLSNIALRREKEELLALLEVKEQEKYEALSCPVALGDYNNFSSLELAVLGACKCPLPNNDPCSCAQSAANLKRDIRLLKDRVEMHKKHHQEALVTVDAYRSAFEEELSRNKTLVKKMADYAIATTPATTKPPSMEERMDKAKAVLKFLIQAMVGDIPPQRLSTFPMGTQVWSCTGGNMKELETAAPDDRLTGKTHEELTLILVEMMSDRSEALAHHRLAARLLAQHTRELEEKLTQMTQKQTSTTDHVGDRLQDTQPSPTASESLQSSNDVNNVVVTNGL